MTCRYINNNNNGTYIVHSNNINVDNIDECNVNNNKNNNR